MGRILVVGGRGFIGRHVAVALKEAGQRVEAPSHEDFDIAREEAADLAQKLAGVEVVVNCAGLARDARLDNIEAVNLEGPKRLAEACKQAGVRRLVHLSTLGAGAADPTRLQRAKGEAETALSAVGDLEVTIVRPSLIMGQGGAIGDFFSALAALPICPRLGPGTWTVQPLHVSELALLVAKLTTAGANAGTVDAVGPSPMTTDAVETTLRRWLGLSDPWFASFPRAFLALLAWANEIVEVGPGDRQLLTLLERGNVGDPAAATAALGRPPRALEESLALTPATTADLWRAALYFVRPMLRIALALLWIGTGLVSFGLFPPSEFYVILAQAGIRGPVAEFALFGGAAVNLALGAMMLVNWRVAKVALAMLALLIVYSLAALLLPSEYWLNPFAPILKNIPIGVALLALMAMENKR